MDLPEAPGLKPVIERWARLIALAGDGLGERPLVLPNATFFPDRFTKDEAGATGLVERMLEHAGMTDVPMTVQVVSEDGPEAPHEGGCASGCQVPAALAGQIPRLVDDGESWTLNVPAFELDHAVVLTTMIARAMGHVFLVETLPEGAHIYTKSCGGPSVSQVTRAGLAELSLVTALFAVQRGHSARRALSELSTTQTAALSEALAFVEERPALVRLLKDDPARVARGDYSLDGEKPWLLRVFGKKKESEAEVFLREIARAAAVKPKAVDAARNELRALVDEAFAEDPAE